MINPSRTGVDPDALAIGVLVGLYWFSFGLFSLPTLGRAAQLRLSQRSPSRN